MRISKEVYCASPCMALMSSATHLPRQATLGLANQLLGAYRIRNGKAIPNMPLVSLDEMRSFLSEAQGQNGVRVLRRLLGWMVPGTASPAESKLAALLALPSRLGGCGLPTPASNAPICAEGNGLKTRRYADFYWERQRLVVEYDSDEFHSQNDRLAQDSSRRAQLQAAGYAVITLTNRQIHHAAEFRDAVDAIRIALGLAPMTCGGGGFSPVEREARDAIYRNVVLSA